MLSATDTEVVSVDGDGFGIAVIVSTGKESVVELVSAVSFFEQLTMNKTLSVTNNVFIINYFWLDVKVVYFHVGVYDLNHNKTNSLFVHNPYKI
ncbi:hypothetical protein D3C72_1658310 [compost metagenome]